MKRIFTRRCQRHFAAMLIKRKNNPLNQQFIKIPNQEPGDK